MNPNQSPNDNPCTNDLSSLSENVTSLFPTSSFSALENHLWTLLRSQSDPLALHSRLVDLIKKVTEGGIIMNIIIAWIRMTLRNNPHNPDIQRIGQEYLQQSADILTTLKNIIETDRKSTRLNSSHLTASRMPSSA